MAAQPAPTVIALRRVAPEARLEGSTRLDTATLPGRLMRRFTLVIAPVNLVIAAVTYVFVAYVVPLPGRAPPARERTTVLIAAIVGVAAAWAVCELWGRHSFRPIRYWLERGGEPDAVARTRGSVGAARGVAHVRGVVDSRGWVRRCGRDGGWLGRCGGAGGGHDRRWRAERVRPDVSRGGVDDAAGDRARARG